ncbi:hypothetical protein HQQ81_05600 [Microbacteriaceae bacterium VKM Ac-2854]|nr:hypothetical protein [Microbacteriaceae bacterium VKM Ac-2854]
MPEWLVSFLSAAGALLVGVGGTFITLRSRDHARIRDLETRVDVVERRERDGWLINRVLIDHIYRGRGLPLPDVVTAYLEERS